MIITISGNPGSGKSTIARLLSQKKGLKHYSMGDLRGKLALDRGITIDELNKLGETEDFTDKEVDEYQKKLGETEDNFVIDGRLSWYFIPQSIKIFLKVDLRVGAERIFKGVQEHGERPDERRYESVDDVMNAIEERLASGKIRYQKWYGIDPTKEEHYDLILDSTGKTPEEVVDEVLAFIDKQ